MEFLTSLFVSRPENILAVSVFFAAGYIMLQFIWRKAVQRPRMLLIASAFWGLYAVWEWLVQIRTPEANIRVDLMVIWPGLALISAWALYRTFR